MQRRFLHTFARDSSSVILHLSPLAQDFPAGFRPEPVVPESEWRSARACVQAAEQAGAAAVWLGGTEPLLHPAIGEVASALADRGFYVFLHTSGAGLRTRIHEFKPVDRLYLTFEVPSQEPTRSEPANRAGQALPLQAVTEAIRVARLSGFHLAGHLTVSEAISPAQAADQLEALGPQHLDGIVVSSGGTFGSLHPSLANTLDEITKLISSSGWRSLSRLLETSFQQTVRRAAAPQSSDTRTSSADACEESA